MKASPGLSQLRLRPLLISSEFLLIAALAFKASPRQLTLVLLLPFGIAMVWAFLRWPPLGLVVAPLAGMIVPYVGPSGLNVTMILVALLLALWLLDMMVLQRQIQLSSSRTLWPLLAFLVIATFSFGLGQLNWLPFALHAPLGAQLGGLAIIVLSAATFLLMANQVRDLVWLKSITWAFLAFGALSILLRTVLPEFGIATQNLTQPVGAVFYIWVVSLAFSQAWLNRDLQPGWRLALVGLLVVTLYNQLFLKYDNKSGWIPALICIVAIIVLRSWRVGLILVPIALVAALMVKAGVLGSEDYSFSTRLDAWLIMTQIIKISPILGLGFANYYWYTPLFPIRGYAISFNSHNNYVDIIAQTGLVGLVCFLWFLWELGRLGWRLRERAPVGFAQAYVYGALGGLAGTAAIMMMGDWVLPFFYNIGLFGFRTSMLSWLFLGGLVSLGRMVTSQN
jgi:hypothetical protein